MCRVCAVNFVPQHEFNTVKFVLQHKFNSTNATRSSKNLQLTSESCKHAQRPRCVLGQGQMRGWCASEAQAPEQARMETEQGQLILLKRRGS